MHTGLAVQPKRLKEHEQSQSGKLLLPFVVRQIYALRTSKPLKLIIRALRGCHEPNFGPKYTRKAMGHPLAQMISIFGTPEKAKIMSFDSTHITPAGLMRLFIIGIVSIVLTFALANPLHAQVKTKASFGDWQVNCGKPPGAKSVRCALVQRVIDEERSNVGLRVVFLQTSKGQNILRVVAPLGVLLPFGLGLRIDDEPIGKQPLPFIRCRPMGCISEIIVKEKLLKKFKAGTTAMFIIVETNDEGRAIPVSLKGFTKGMERLSELAKSK